MRWLIVILIAACGAPQKPTLPKQAPAVPADDLAIAKGDARPVRGDSNLVVKDPRIVDLDIIRIRVPQVGPDHGGGSVATADLFRLANEAAKDGKALDAIKRYRQIISEFPDSLYAPVSLFNIAALQDKQGDHSATIATLRELIAAYPTSQESVEGHLYIAALQSEKRQWADAIATLDAALVRTNLTYANRVEAHARRGYGLLELGRYDEADTAFIAAVGEWRKAPRIDDTYYIAMASYYAGEIAHRKFTAAPIRQPDDLLHADLETKRVLATQAYDRWKQSLGHNHAYWGTAAGYQMSQIFFELWEVTVKAPYPTKMAVTARDKYVVEVHERVRPYLVKSLAGHKMNLELAKAYGVETSWSKGSALRAAEIFQLLQQDSSGGFIKPSS